KPGQQASISQSSKPIQVQTADIDKAIAWKTGLFSFDDDELPYVMKQLGRWYDVEVSFTGAVPHDTYSGLISRQFTLLQVLKILQVAGLKYTIEGKKIKMEKNN